MDLYCGTGENRLNFVSHKIISILSSHVIMKYLVDQYGKDDSLHPKDAKKGAIVNHRLFFSATVLFPRLQDYCICIDIKSVLPFTFL